MNLRCLFGHKYEVTLKSKELQRDLNTGKALGYNYYTIKTCNKCSKEVGSESSVYGRTQEMNPSHIRRFYPESKE